MPEIPGKRISSYPLSILAKSWNEKATCFSLSGSQDVYIRGKEGDEEAPSKYSHRLLFFCPSNLLVTASFGFIC